MSEKYLEKKLTISKQRLNNKIIYLVYKKVIEKHSKLIDFIKETIGQDPKQVTIYNVRKCDNILEPHTIVLIYLPTYFEKNKAFDIFDYKKEKPDIYKMTAGVAKDLEIILNTKRIIDPAVLPLSYNKKPKENSSEEDKKKKTKARAPIEVPLAISNYTNYFPTTLRKSTVYSAGNKPLKMRIDNNLNGLNQEMGVEYTFLTVCLLPSQLTLLSSWELMPYFETQIKDILFTKFPAIKYILSAIEIHTSKENKKDKAESKEREPSPAPKKKKKPIIVKRNGKTEEAIPPSPAEKPVSKNNKPSKEEKEDSSDEDSEEDEDSENNSEEDEEVKTGPNIKDIVNIGNTLVKHKKKEDSSEDSFRSNKVQKGNIKSIRAKEKAKDADKLDPETMNIEKLKYSPYIHKLDSTTTAIKEVLRVFWFYDESLRPSICSETEIIVKRAFDYYCNRVTELKVKIPTIFNTKTLTPFAHDIYELLVLSSNNVVKSKSKKLNRFPHIHMAIARTKNPLTGEYDDLTAYYRALAAPNTLFTDIFIKDKLGKAGITPKGKQLVDVSASNILAYCIKNSQHDVVHDLLGREPCTLFNPYNITAVNDFFADLVAYNEINILDVKPLSNPGNSIEYEPVRPKDKKTQNIYDAKDRLVAYMNKNNYKINYDNVKYPDIWAKVEGSKNSWVPRFKREDLWAKFSTTGYNMDIYSQKNTLLEIMLSKEQQFFPIIILDYQTIEFKDFFLHFNTGTFSEPDEEHISFYYNDKLSLSDFQSKSPKLPKMWLNILKNSLYMSEDNIPTELGRLLLYSIYELLTPKVHKRKGVALVGDPNSAKTTLILILLGIFPLDKIGIISKSNGFESSQFSKKEILNFDELNLKDLGISQDTIKKLLEGYVQFIINEKNQTLKTEKVTARSSITANNLDALSIIRDKFLSLLDPENENKPKKKSSSPVKVRKAFSIEETQEYLIERYDIDPAFPVRLNFFPFTEMKNKIENAIDLITRDETHLVIAYLTNFYGKNEHFTSKKLFDAAVVYNKENPTIKKVDTKKKESTSISTKKVDKTKVDKLKAHKE